MLRNGPNYLDICHPAKPGDILWVHLRKDGIEIQAELNHSDTNRYDCSGRIDPVKKIGSMSFKTSVDRRRARRIAERAIGEFTGIRFMVFFYTDTLRYGTSMQEFWEATE